MSARTPREIEPGSGALRRFAVMFGAGALGVLALLPVILPEIRRQAGLLGEAAPPLPVLLALSVVQPLVLVALAVFLGNTLSPRMGLRSHLLRAASGGGVEWGRLRGEAPLALGLGAAAAVALLALDSLTRPWLGEAGAGMALTAGRTLRTTALGVLYGGITEEILTRWGLTTLLAWPVWALLRAPERGPGGAIMWPAIVVAALLFGAGHLPAVAVQGIDLTGPVVARTILLNGVAGIAFGWLYWRRSLEAAMVAHASVHLVWSAAALFV